MATLFYVLAGLHLLAAPVVFLAGLANRSPAGTAWMIGSAGVLTTGFFWLGFAYGLTLLHRIATK